MRRTAILWSLAALALPTLAAAQESQLFPEARQGPSAAGPAVIYTAELIAVPKITPDLPQVLQPLHSLQQAEEALKVRGLSFAWRRGELNSTALPPDFARQLATLPPHEVFVVPQKDGGIVMGMIVQQRSATSGAAPAPLPGPPPRR